MKIFFMHTAHSPLTRFISTTADTFTARETKGAGEVSLGPAEGYLPPAGRAHDFRVPSNDGRIARHRACPGQSYSLIPPRIGIRVGTFFLCVFEACLVKCLREPPRDIFLLFISAPYGLDTRLVSVSNLRSRMYGCKRGAPGEPVPPIFLGPRSRLRLHRWVF